jgi:hypothetical protein
MIDATAADADCDVRARPNHLVQPCELLPQGSYRIGEPVAIESLTDFDQLKRFHATQQINTVQYAPKKPQSLTHLRHRNRTPTTAPVPDMSQIVEKQFV